MKKKGFTLIELIIVIAIIAILAAIAFVAVNPAKRIGEANDDQRWSDITAIADAWEKYVSDNAATNIGNPTLPGSAVSGTIYEISSAGAGTGWVDDCAATATTAFVDLDLLVNTGYLGQIPTEPTGVTGSKTGYWLEVTGVPPANTMLKVGACDTYSDSPIFVSR